MYLIINLSNAQAMGDYSPAARKIERQRSARLEAMSDEDHVRAARADAWIVNGETKNEILRESHDSLWAIEITDEQAREIRQRG